MVVTGAVGLATGGAASADGDPGVGSSYAQGLQVAPHEGSLAVGATFDEALAGHTDKIARAQSQGLDLGAIGESMQGYNCGQPPSAGQYVPNPLQAETPSSGGSVDQSAGPSPQDNNSDGSVEHVLANDVPYGEADTSFAGPISGPNNFISVSGITTKAWSGLVNGARDAGATSDIGAVNIAGVVSLSHLHWEVDYPDGKAPTSTFSIGKAVINGNSVPTGDASQLFDAINTALSNIGLVVQYPVASNEQGIQFESPLQFEVVPNNTRDSVIDQIITGAVQPNEYPATNALENGFAGASPPYNSLAPIEQNDPTTPLEKPGDNYYGIQQALCQSDTPITVADVTIASFTSAGYFNLALGGVNATAGPLPVNSFNLAEFGFGTLSNASSQLSGATAGLAGTAGTPAIAGTPGQAIPGSAGSGGTPQRISPASASTVAAGPLLGIGLGVLGFLALLAEADRRMIRRTFNTASFEE